MAGMVHVPWYATGLRDDKLEAALLDVSATALRYGATSWQLHRSRDDRYKMLQMIGFEAKEDFERWWNGQEMVDFRVITSGWWQVPVLYAWHDLCGAGAINGNGGEPAAAPEHESEPSSVA